MELMIQTWPYAFPSSRQESFARAKQWVEKLKKEVMGRNNKKQLVVAVVANKMDKLAERNKYLRVWRLSLLS